MLALVKRLRRPRVRVSEATALGRRGTALLLALRQGAFGAGCAAPCGRVRTVGGGRGHAAHPAPHLCDVGD